MTSFNIDNFQQRTLEIKIKFLTIFTVITISVLTFFSLFFMQLIYLPLAIAEWVTMLGLFINYLYLYKTKNIEVASYVLLFFVGVISLAVYTQGGMNETGNLWLVLFPLLAFYLLGEKKGFILIGMYTFVLLVISYLIMSNMIDHPFSDVKVRNTLIVYAVVVILSYYNEKLKMLATHETTNAYENLRKIFENMQDTYYRVDVNGRVEVISNSGYMLMGYRQDEVLGKRLTDYYFDRRQRYKFIKAFKKSAGKILGYEIQLRHKSGRSVWVLLDAQYIYDEAGNVIGSEGTVTNISAYKRMQNDLIELNSVLENRVQSGIDEIRERDKMMLQQAKFAQMGELLAMIAHQWRQPLSAVAAITSNMKISIALDEALSNDILLENFNHIDEHIALLSSTIDDFRNFFRSDKKRVNIDLNGVIDKGLFVLKPAISTHKIEIEVSGEFSQNIYSLESEIIQVIINLLNNAIDALDALDATRTISIRKSSDAKNQIITIEDNGGGIAPELLSKIFEPYFSTKLEKNGTGLGLYMSKTIIEEHCGGSLRVSNEKEGACFRISLPNEV